MPAPADSNETVKSNNAAEAAFVDTFASKLAAGEVGVDRGRAQADRIAAEEAAAPAGSKKATTTDKKSESAASGTPSGKAAPADGSETDPDDDVDGADDDAETGDTPAADDGEGAADDETNTGEGEAGEGDEDGETGGAAEEIADDRELDDLSDDELAQEARTQLTKHGVTVTMDDLDPKARQLVKTKLDHMIAGYTRAMMDQRSYRQAEIQFRAEQEFIKAHPDLMVAEMLAKDPELLDRIQARIDEAGTESGKKAQEIVIRDERRNAVETIQQQNAAVERVQQRADVIETYVKQACTKLNLPFDIVVDAVVNKLNEKPLDQRDLSNQEIDAVIGRQQRILAKHIGDRKLTQRQEEIRGRKTDRKTVSPAAKSTAGAVPAAAGKKPVPKNDSEFIDQFLAKGSRSR